MGNIVDFDNWYVAAVTDAKHRERFVIAFVNLAEGAMKPTTMGLTEGQIREELDRMGVGERADELIQRARDHAKAQTS